MSYLILSENRIVAKSNDNVMEIIDYDRAPMAFSFGMSFYEWVSGRALDGTRTHGRILKKTHGLSSFASDFDTAMKYHAAVITDNFWVKEESEDLRYEDIAFKDDKYFLMAISQDAAVLDNKSSRTPELTNIGSQEKGWKLIDGEWWLYKNETSAEICHEILTSFIGKELGFNMATYEFDNGYIRTKDFTEGKYNLQHADSIMKEHVDADGKKVTDEDWKYNYLEFRKLSEDIANDYLNILYLDAICNNVDRHTKNYGLLTESESGDIIGLAPNYDNNMSFYGIDNTTKTVSKLSRDFVTFIEENEIDFKVATSLDFDKMKVRFESQYKLGENIDNLLEYVGNNINYILEKIKALIEVEQ